MHALDQRGPSRRLPSRPADSRSGRRRDAPALPLPSVVPTETPSAVAARNIARLLPVTSHRSFPAPLFQRVVDQVTELLGVAPTAAAALHVLGTDRWLYALTGSDDRGVVVKVGRADDQGLAREASTLAALRAIQSSLQVPVLRWHGQQDDSFALVTDIVKRRKGADGVGIEDAA